MKLSIEVLERELERQNLLIQSNIHIVLDELGEQKEILRAPANMLQLRDELERAIKILSLERWQK